MSSGRSALDIPSRVQGATEWAGGIAIDDGTLLNVRLLETELGANLELSWKTVPEERSSYDAVPVTQGGIGYRRVSEVYGSEARLFVVDIPLLDDADDVGRVMTGFYWGAGACKLADNAKLFAAERADKLLAKADLETPGA
jgi:hypothetical protein